jgi:predicted DNA-binding protein with PD1-like motif
MRYAQAKQGRIFVIRLEDGDIIHEKIEQFAREEAISCASLIIIGGADEGSRLVVGPEHGRTRPVQPMEWILDNVHEITGTGTIFPDQKGNPILHMHIACGRGESSITGCVRKGVRVWHIMEIVLFELIECTGTRAFDQNTGFELLQP